MSGLKAIPDPTRKNRRWISLLMLVSIFVVGSIFILFFVRRADRVMREELLAHTAQTVEEFSVDRIQFLSGSEDDLKDPNYKSIKKQLFSIRAAHPGLRFVYLLGRKADESIFFYADNEPVNSNDYSPPGQIYVEAPPGYQRVFVKKEMLVEGPTPDRWGNWVFALAPIKDPKTDAVIAALGFYIDAGQWKRDLAGKAALPVGFILLLLVISVTAASLYHPVDISPKPVMRRLLWPLAAMLAALFLVGWWLFWSQHRHEISAEQREHVAEFSGAFRKAVSQRAGQLGTAMSAIADDVSVRDALRTRDANRLFAAWQGAFESWQLGLSLNEIVFMDQDRSCVLSVMESRHRGELVDDFVAVETASTGKKSFGLELEPSGLLSVKVAAPLFMDGNLIGYLEVAKGVEDLLEELHELTNNQLSVVVKKNLLNRQSWEVNRRSTGRPIEWDRLPFQVEIYSSQNRLPEAFLPWAKSVSTEQEQYETIREIVDQGREVMVAAIPMMVDSDLEIGHLLVMRDVTAENAEFLRLATFGGVFGAVLLAILLGFVFVLLRRTDAGISAQTALLKESEDRHRKLFEASQDALMTLAPPTWNFTSCNPSAVELFHVPDETEFITLGPAALSPERQPSGRNSDEMAAVMIDTAVRQGSNFFEWTHCRANGETFPAEVLLTRVIRGGETYLQANVRDITTRKNVQRILEEKEARLRAITDSAQDAIMAIDNRGSITFWNPAAESILGYRADEVMGRNLHALIVPTRYHEAHHSAFPRFQMTGSGDAIGKTLELEAIRKDGVEISVSLSLSSVMIDGRWNAIGVMRDNTDQKWAERQLLDANERLEKQTEVARVMADQAEKANAAKGDFLANMSHEIRTPMNGVIGMTSLLLDTGLTDEQKKYAETVRNSAESLLTVLNDILDFSKIEAGKLEMEVIDFDLRALMEDFSSILALRAHDKDIEFICAVSPDVPTHLRGDPGRLRQILTNLAGNAIKFTHRGEIAVRVGLMEESSGSVALRFSVKDTGIGIPEDKQAILFNKFVQADASTTRQYGGTGLGLAISKELVERMGGEIGIVSRQGTGSEFWFTVNFAKQPDAAEDTNKEPVDIRGLHVLIVDDNPTNRDVYVTQLAAWGVRVEAVWDGPTALHTLYRARDAGDPFQGAILDMQMPGMDGAELARTIKADKSLCTIKLVLMTSLGHRGDAKRMEEIGFAAYLVKPARNADLFQCLSSVLADNADASPAPPIVTRHTVRELSRRDVRILMAEDNITNQKVVLGFLKKLGLSADPVTNGALALQALENASYDLVLMDVQMPEMDGFEATRLIRDPNTTVRNHDIPVIAMTAHALKGDRERCMEAGMSDYITKPINSQFLADVLDRWLPEERPGNSRPESVPISETSIAPSRRNGTPVFDGQGLLTRLMGDRDLVEEVVGSFLDDIPVQIGQLKECLSAGDGSGVERRAHAIKGAAANVGGEALRAIAFKMENAGRIGDLPAAKADFELLIAEFQQLRIALIDAAQKIAGVPTLNDRRDHTPKVEL